MKAVAFHPDALAELQAQALYYEERSEGLGERFVTQVEVALSLAQTMPDIGSPYLHGTRRVFPRDFPHSIVYREAVDRLVVFAIAPFRRKPDYWRGRK